MAEVTGLVFGAVSLASLFSTCAQLFDCFELGRSYRDDYELACNKLDLLKTRLSKCGHNLNIQGLGYESASVPRRWTTEEELVVRRSLEGIKRILGNTSLLEEKYRLEQTSKRSLRFCSAKSTSEGASNQRNILSISKSTSSRLSLLRRRTIWAIHDKAKLDDLINDLSFMMSNVEKVTESTSPSGSPPKPTAAAQHTTHPQTGITIKGKQTNFADAVGLQGSLAPDNRALSVKGDQDNQGFSVGIQGGATAEGLATIQDRTKARYEGQNKG